MRTAKIGAIFLISVMALAGVTAGYAMWYETLYIDGTINQIQVVSFLVGLLTNCFILSSLYKITQNLWMCVMTHALINMLAQIALEGNEYISMICKLFIIIIAIYISEKSLNLKDRI